MRANKTRLDNPLPDPCRNDFSDFKLQPCVDVALPVAGRQRFDVREEINPMKRLATVSALIFLFSIAGCAFSVWELGRFRKETDSFSGYFEAFVRGAFGDPLGAAIDYRDGIEFRELVVNMFSVFSLLALIVTLISLYLIHRRSGKPMKERIRSSQTSRASIEYRDR